MLDAAPMQIVFVGIVRVESRSADVGGLAYLLDRNGIVVLLQDQGDQGAVQCRLSAGDTAVDRFCGWSPVFAVKAIILCDTGHRCGFVRQKRFGLLVRYCTSCPYLQRERL